MLRIIQARPSGGKAGKGRNKTSTLQVWDDEERMILKHFRYTVGSPTSISLANYKATAFIRQYKRELK